MSDRKIIKEFLGTILKKVASIKGRNYAKKLLKSPEMKRIAKDSLKLRNDIRKSQEKAAANGDETAKTVLDILKKMGY